MRGIVEGLKECLQTKGKAVIATIINIEGSAYQPIGTHCLIKEDGLIVGLISGGCVEEDLKYKVSEILNDHQPQTAYYDFRTEGDLIWGMGLGCDGAITVYLQPFDPVNYIDEAITLYEQYEMNDGAKSTYQLATVVNSPQESYVPKGSQFILPHLEKNGLTQVEIDDDLLECFVETIHPRQHVVIFGAGPDVLPVVNELASIEWHITIYDHRPHLASKQNFPQADDVILINKSEYKRLSLNENTYCIIMTHNFELDYQLIQCGLRNNLSYIGVLSARRRFEKLLQRLPKDYQLPNDVIHSPIGLDIGAISPQEIAISIVAELISCRNKTFKEDNDKLNA